MRDERLQILEMVENGVITPEEGAQLINALEGEKSPREEGEADASNSAHPSSNGFSKQILLPEINSTEPAPEIEDETNDWMFDPNLQHYRRWWIIPMWIGIAITVVGGMFMFLAWQTAGLGFWFGCAWVPFLFGVGLMALAWASRTSRWLHLRIHQKPGERPQTILLSMPLPLRFTAWFLRTFGKYIPQWSITGVDELILALENTTGPDNPFYIEVDEGEDGEQVQIYIG